MVKSKIETYLGFCIRSGKIIFGTTEIERKKKGVFLLLADGGIGKNSLKIMVNAAEKLHCPLYLTNEAGALGPNHFLKWQHRRLLLRIENR